MEMFFYYIKLTLGMTALCLMILSGLVVSGAFIWMMANIMMELKEIFQGWQLGAWMLGMTVICCLPAIATIAGSGGLEELLIPKRPRRKRNSFTL